MGVKTDGGHMATQLRKEVNAGELNDESGWKKKVEPSFGYSDGIGKVGGILSDGMGSSV